MGRDEYVTERVRFYTGARRFPQMIGKIGDLRLFGGPYTTAQFLVGILGIWVLVQSAPLWARSSNLFLNLLVGVLLLVGLVRLVGLLPSMSFSPGLRARGLLRVYLAPREGTYRGQRLRVRRPHRLRTRISVPLEELAVPGSMPAATAATSPGPTAPSEHRSHAAPVSNVSALLARTLKAEGAGR